MKISNTSQKVAAEIVNQIELSINEISMLSIETLYGILDDIIQDYDLKVDPFTGLYVYDKEYYELRDEYNRQRW